jgi:nucleotidyltransferase AbiEii toxin of type IV toxin-antitoxin system
VNRLAVALERVRSELDRLELHWAVIGGLALAVRAEPRQTRDIDVAIAVEDDSQAEGAVRSLTAGGLRFVEEGVLEQTAVGRLATVRLQVPARHAEDLVPVDLFFASSCVESELVAAAERLEVLPGLSLPVATTGFLIALKVLAGRLQDLADVDSLLRTATAADVDEARRVIGWITARGCHRGNDLAAVLERRICSTPEPAA